MPYCSATDRHTQALCRGTLAPRTIPRCSDSRLFLIDNDELNPSVGSAPIVSVNASIGRISPKPAVSRGARRERTNSAASLRGPDQLQVGHVRPHESV